MQNAESLTGGWHIAYELLPLHSSPLENQTGVVGAQERERV